MSATQLRPLKGTSQIRSTVRSGPLKWTKSRTFALRFVVDRYSGPDPHPIEHQPAANGRTGIGPVPDM